LTDRPNLTYRVTPRRELLKQVLDVIARYPNEGGIIYCIRRADVDELTKKLTARGISALPYHAGLSNEQRGKAQDAFLEEKCNVIVATVAFGMGIDRSNVRYVMHTGMPKSLEHYQQETGRAGRDGLDAECVLFHSGADFFTWKSIIEKSAKELEAGSDFIESSMDHLREMDRYCRSAACRHYTLVRYFGQEPRFSSCSACDLCLGETSVLEDSSTVAKKIISCVYRVNQRFGIKHVVTVLRGLNSEQVKRSNHEALSTFGILKDQSEDNLRDWIYQLIGQNALAQEEVQGFGGQTYPILKLTRESAEVLKDLREVRLLRPVEKKRTRRESAAKAAESATDMNLFEVLRALRKRIASDKRVPPYVIFSDATLKEMARIKPASLLEMRRISGVGDIKLRDYGGEFLEAVSTFENN
jgi:ATP-dependent DNA helicase RecQ